MDSILENNLQPLATKTIVENESNTIWPKLVERINKGTWIGTIHTPNIKGGDIITLIKDNLNSKLQQTGEYKLDTFEDYCMI
jgi:hypothetical protein